MFKSKKGSLTVEAALILPIFLCAVISIVFLVKAVFVHEVLQHAISETANELSAYSYILTVSKAAELDKLLTEGMENKAEKFNEHMTSYMEGYNALSEFGGELKNKLGNDITDIKEGDISPKNIEGITGDFEDVKAKIEEALKNGKEAFSNPKEEAAGMLFSMGGFAYDKSKGALLGEITKLFIKKYLKTEKLPDAHNRLKALNVEDGFSGLDFSKSQLYSDGRNIEIIVQYRLNLGLPYNIMPDILICQRAYARAWLEGDDFGGAEGSGKGDTDKEKESSIWDLPPTKRGEEIQRKYYNKNTPKYFKVITKFEDGTATRVTSIDTRSVTYKKPSNLKSSVKSDISKLEEFEGDSREGFTVRKSDIVQRKLIIVVPKGEVSPEQRKVLEQCIKDAGAKGINMIVDEL